MNNLTLLFSIVLIGYSDVFAISEPLKVGVIRLTHGHANWIFNSEKRGEIEIVGIVEPNRDLARKYADKHKFSMDKLCDSMQELIDKKSVEAVTAFGSIYEHLEVVEFFAPRGIHVMVEKPLAVSLEHARKMEALAKKYGIYLLTNYETTWYPTNHQAKESVNKGKAIGEIRKVILRDGHKGPKKIGVNDEFFEWLTDPKLNGGGAIIDFGCYGANLITWIMEGNRPESVTAILQQLQPENNPKVDDEANIILTYDNAVVIIEASWKWPIGRKDMDIYGEKGVVYVVDRNQMKIQISEGYDGYSEEVINLKERDTPFDDPFAYFAALIKGEVKLQPYDLSSLENNIIVMEILDAAIRSAQLGKTVRF